MANETTIRISAVNATSEAFRQVQGNLNKLQGSLKSLAAPLAAAFSVGAVVQFSRNILETADNLGKLAQKTGMTVEDLSAFQLAADLAGVSSESFASATLRLNKAIADARGGAKLQEEAFKNLGITQADLARLSPAQVLERIADSFANAKDGASKTQIAMALLGKSGAELIPLLNGGSDALRQFGSTFSTEFAKNAEIFNDNLRLLQENITKFTINFLAPLVQNINEFFGAYTETGLEQAIARTREEIERLRNSTVNATDEFGGALDGMSGVMQGNEAAIAEAEARLRKFEQALKDVKKAASIKIPKNDLNNITTAATEIVGFDEAIMERLYKLDMSDRSNALYEYADAARDVNKSMQDAALGGLRNMEDALTGVFMGTMSVKDAFKSMARSIVADLIKIQIQRSITGPLADVLGSFFPTTGKKAIGGSVSLGSPYVVGERGPELFVPNQNGAIIPNKALGGGGGTTIVNQTLQISTGVSQTVRAEIQNMMPRIAEMTKAAVVDAKLRGGTFGKIMA